MQVLHRMCGTCRVGCGGCTETPTRDGVFLQGYTRTPGKGGHFSADLTEQSGTGKYPGTLKPYSAEYDLGSICLGVILGKHLKFVALEA